MSESSATDHRKQSPLLSDRNYNVLKKTATIILPAVAALYISLGQIWHLPKVEEVVASVTALNTFLGVLIQVSKKSYYATNAQYMGEINIRDSADGTKKVFSLELNDEPESMEDKDEVTFKVNTNNNPNHKA